MLLSHATLLLLGSALQSGALTSVPPPGSSAEDSLFDARLTRWGIDAGVTFAHTNLFWPDTTPVWQTAAESGQKSFAPQRLSMLTLHYAGEMQQQLMTSLDDFFGGSVLGYIRSDERPRCAP